MHLFPEDKAHLFWDYFNMKILVSGNAGAGKSSLGRRLAKKHQIPLYGLDRIVWQEGWKKTPQEEKVEKIKEILAKDSWVLEGITKDGLLEADIVYFLDIHPIRCALNVIKRFLNNGPGSRPELPDKCPEYIGFLKALKTNFLFHRVTKPWLLDETQRKDGADFIRIYSYKELDVLFR